MTNHNCTHTKIKKDKFFKIIIISIIFIVIEIIGAILSKSTAILNDSFHLISDLFGFSISYFGIWVSTKKVNVNYSSGFYMAETLTALFSVQITWIMIYFIIKEAIERIILKKYEEIIIKDMLLVSIIGFFVNILMIKILHSHNHNHNEESISKSINKVIIINTVNDYEQKISSENKNENKCCHKSNGCIESKPFDNQIILNNVNSNSKNTSNVTNNQIIKDNSNNYIHDDHNTKAAMIHIIGDLLQSVSVVIVSIVLCFNDKIKILDPLLSILFSIIAFIISIKVFIDIINAIMNKTPEYINLNKIIDFIESKNLKLKKYQLNIDQKKKYSINIKLKNGELSKESINELKTILKNMRIENLYMII